MSTTTFSQTIITADENTHYNHLYRLGAWAAWGMIAVGLLDIAITFLPGGQSPEAGAVLDWFALYRTNWFYGLRGLGLFNVLTTSLGLIVFFALYQAHRRTPTATTAALALLVLTLASAVYIANNRALPMLSLSNQYYTTGSQTEKEAVVAAGTGMLAQSEDFTPGTFLGFTLIEAAGVVMSAALLRGKVFSKAAALTCLAGYALLLIYSSLVCFRPQNLIPFMPLSMIGGLASMAGFFMIARWLFRLSAAVQEVK